MTQEDERFLNQLRATFKLEAEEHLGAMQSLRQQLERDPGDEARTRVVEALFREAHSLKGAARSVNFADIERVCQALERVLSLMKRGELALSRGFTDTLSRTLDGLARMLAHHVDGQAAIDPNLAVTLGRALGSLLAPSSGVAAAAPQAAPAASTAMPVANEARAEVLQTTATPPAADTVRIATAKLEELMTQAEELQALKFANEHLVDELQVLTQAMAERRRRIDRQARQARVLRRAGVGRSGSIALRHQRVLAQLLDAGANDDLTVKALAERIARLARTAAQERRALVSRVDRLLDDVKQVLMLPLATLLSPLARTVRELARDAGKEAELVVDGGSLEVDRRILEQLRAPLTHLVRNAIDHGIEPPAQRQLAGKPARGRITIGVTPREGNRVELTIADDGAGIALERVRAKALKLGLLSERAAAAATPAQLADLVFESGLSTSAMLTDLSGHGLGLAIVREKVEAMGGTVGLDAAAEGPGARFLIVLPATLATFRGLLVQVAGRAFVLPSRQVERVGRVARAVVQVDAGAASVLLGDERLPLASLAAVLELPGAPADARDKLQLVVMVSGDKRIAFVVDEVVGDQEVLVKPLASPLKRVRNIAGATVLGAGRVVPLLNVQDLVKAAQQATHRAGAALSPAEAAPRSLLVAEDSVTSRLQLKGILEGAGYRVATAGDGMDALEQLRHGTFDLVVSDVEMPRLDGFGLTARLRTDPRFAALPVVLVTGLDSREDRQRGAEVGANAYIVKSGFRAGRLLDTIRTLL